MYILECLRHREDTARDTFLHSAFANRDRISAVKGEPSGKDIENRLVNLMSNGSKKLQQELVDAHETLTSNQLAFAFAAAVKCCSPAQVFKEFSPYLLIKGEPKTKSNRGAAQKRAIIFEQLCSILGARYDFHPVWSIDADALRTIDRRWLDLVVAHKELFTTLCLAVPGHRKANQFMQDKLGEKLKRGNNEFEAYSILAAMIRVQHPAATDSVVAAIKRFSKQAEVYFFATLIPSLAKAAVPQLESLLSTLPERAVDIVSDNIEELKKL
jgi:hypothetical protein